MPPRRGSRPGDQHRFAKTRPAEFSDPRLDEWVAWQLAARLAPAAGKRRASIVDNFAREAGVDPVTATSADLMGWFAGRDDLSRSTSALYFEYLNAWFSWLIRMEYRVDNPLLKLQKPSKSIGEPRPVSDVDIGRQRRVASDDWHRFRHRHGATKELLLAPHEACALADELLTLAYKTTGQPGRARGCCPAASARRP